MAAPVRKCREATEAAQTGWSLTPQVFRMHSRKTWLVSDHPVRSEYSGFALFFLMLRPPLLREEGNIAYPNQFVHTITARSQTAPTVKESYVSQHVLVFRRPFDAVNHDDIGRRSGRVELQSELLLHGREQIGRGIDRVWGRRRGSA